MSTGISLSYVLTTFNKLPYLQEVMIQLIQNCKADEEIIVTDGGSTDGTVYYLDKLYKEGLIHQFVSEKDFGEAHGFNKGILLAKGSLIKLLSDDDIFDYAVINSCKDYMLANPRIDIMIANICSFNSMKKPSQLVFVKSYEIWFKEWVNKRVTNCFFCCLPIIIRNSSLSYIGLLDPSFKHVDFEYAVRITSKKHAKIAFSSDIMVAAFLNSKSVSQNFGAIVDTEVEKVSKFYNYTYPIGEIKSKPQKTNLLKKISSKISSRKPAQPIQLYPDYNYILEEDIFFDNLKEAFDKLKVLVSNYNKINRTEVISN